MFLESWIVHDIVDEIKVCRNLETAEREVKRIIEEINPLTYTQFLSLIATLHQFREWGVEFTTSLEYVDLDKFMDNLINEMKIAVIRFKE